MTPEETLTHLNNTIADKAAMFKAWIIVALVAFLIIFDLPRRLWRWLRENIKAFYKVIDF